MGPRSHMQSVVDRNVVMRRISVWVFRRYGKCIATKITLSDILIIKNLIIFCLEILPADIVRTEKDTKISIRNCTVFWTPHPTEFLIQSKCTLTPPLHFIVALFNKMVNLKFVDGTETAAERWTGIVCEDTRWRFFAVELWRTSEVVSGDWWEQWMC